MEPYDHRRFKSRLAPWVSILAAVLLVFLGWGSGEWSARQADARERDALLRQAADISQVIDVELVRLLTFTSSDQGTWAFERLRDQLIAYSRIGPQHDIYTLAQREGRLVYGPESHAVDAPRAHLPGTVMVEPDPIHLEVFATGTLSILGPVADAHESSISALAPVFDPYTGEVLLVVGIDLPVQVHQRRLDVARWPLWISTCVGALVVLVGVVLIRRRDRSPAEGSGFWQHIESLIVGGVGLVVTLSVVLLLRNTTRLERIRTFEGRSRSIAAEVSDALRDIEINVSTLARFFAGSQQVDPQELTVFAEPMLRDPGVQGYQWVAAVDAERRAEFEAAAQRVGLEAFTIWSADTSATFPSLSEPDIYYPVLYAVPWEDNAADIGLDMRTAPDRWPAFELAARTGGLTASSPLTLSSAAGPQMGFVVAQPVYTTADPLSASRASAADASSVPLQGFALAVLRLQSLLDAELTLDRDALVSVHLVDLERGNEAALLATYPRAPEADLAEIVDVTPTGPFAIVHPLSLAGRPLAFVARPTPEFYVVYPEQSPWLVGAAFLSLTVALSALVGFLHNRQRRLEEAVQISSDRYRMLFERTPSPVLAIDPSGRYVGGNDAALSFLECTQDELLTMTVFDILPAGMLEIMDAHRALWESGGRVETVYDVHGKMKTLDLTVTPLKRDGQEIVIGIGTDITARKEAEHALRQRLDDQRAVVSCMRILVETTLLKRQLKNVVRRLRAALEVSRVYVYQGMDDQGDAWSLSLTHEAIGDGVAPRQPQALRLSQSGGADESALLDHLLAWEPYSVTKTVPDAPPPLLMAPDARSLLILPIFVGSDLWGVLGFDDCANARAWDTDTVALLQIVADGIGASVRRKKGSAALERRVAELTALHAATSACAEAREEDRLIEEIGGLIDAAIHPDDFGLFVMDAAGDLRPHPTYHQAVGSPAAVISLGKGVVGRAAESRRPLRIADTRLEENYISTSPETRSELAVPVKLDERVIAVINVESAQVGHFTVDDERLLVTIAGQLAIALERFALNRQVQRRLIELEALHHASQEILAAGTDAERVYASVHQVVADLMDAEAFTIVLHHAEEGFNEAVYAIDRGGRAPVMRLPANEGLSGHVVALGQTVLLNDFSWGDDARVVHFGSSDPVRSILAVPLRTNERVIGVLSAQSYAVDAYSMHDQVLLETVANHVAAGLETIHHFQRAQEQAQRVRAILDSVPEGVLLLDGAGHVLLANPIAERDLMLLTDTPADQAVTHLGGRPLVEVLDSPPSGLWHEVEADDHVFEVIARPLAQGGDAEHYVMVLDDVSEERRVRTELQRQERLAAVGQLAAGIAHDFNNILAVIILYAQLDLQISDLPVRHRRHLETITDQAHHAARLVQQILDFGRQAMLEPQPLDLVPFFKEQVKLLSRTLPEYVKIDLVLETDTMTVLADPTRMQQLLTNLAVNARDAMPGGGELRIRLAEFVLRRRGDAPVPEMQPGRWALLAVGDTGTGIAPEVHEHLFEPFYTTKEPGMGTGLGLAQVYGIVKQHDGHIGVETALNEGTTFTVYLPVLEAEASDEASSQTAGLPLGHGETVLVVEDNDMVRDAVVSTLVSLNYRVLEATNGKEALDCLTGAGCRLSDGEGDAVTIAADSDVAVVLTDLVMPDIGGQALFYALKKRGLEIPVVILSGHPMGDDLREMRAQGLAGWLHKPPEIGALAEMLAGVLAA